ncbi:MAG: excinuclease ABC subunit UvrB [Candidatus Melainabacteria bacterium]|nr:excinuclease ABC subunit UvrB [Candidatus Melainabacteria bacterium]
MKSTVSHSFKIVSKFKPDGDQPKAIKELKAGIENGLQYQTLLGVTGSGKTFTIANLINEIQKPALVIAHNKTLAAQLCNEFREFLPENAVEYFISYYDYYQPESYIPQTDTYIEKVASINDEIDRLRHSTTRSLFERNDVLVVASVSCIYGLGIPELYYESAITIKKGQNIDRDNLLRLLVGIYYERNDLELTRGKFRARGEIVDLFPIYEEEVIRIEFFGDTIENMVIVDPITGEIKDKVEEVKIYPAKHYVADEESIEEACEKINEELKERHEELKKQGKNVEAQRLWQRTKFDIEMLKETGYCTGVENYSRILENRNPGDPPQVLIDYFNRKYGKNGWVCIIDESHVSIPQLGGMYHGDASRKDTLIEYGFRLPCAKDNRPLKPAEFWARVPQAIFVSATPGPYELEISQQIVEQIVRPTGLVDPEVEVRGIQGQIDDLINEIKLRTEKKERVLISTLTKKMAEDLTSYLAGMNIKVRWLHSDIDALERIEILRDLRLGEFDVLVGVNLLREGLDLPEVSLVCIMDADKEGFLRAERALIQMIGRAARNAAGKVILYADRITESMKKAIFETERRRQLQIEYNKKHNITPRTIVKGHSNPILDSLRTNKDAEEIIAEELAHEKAKLKDLPKIIKKIENEMKNAALLLDFEKATKLRDQLYALREKAAKKKK